MGQGQLPTREELLVELIRASEENVRLTEERLELYGRIGTDTTIVIDLSIRINQLSNNVERLDAEVERLNNRIDETRQRHQGQINSIQSINRQAITRHEQDITQL
jgi:outer membrane murein-binding lipoprotein Lpp